MVIMKSKEKMSKIQKSTDYYLDRPFENIITMCGTSFEPESKNSPEASRKASPRRAGPRIRLVSLIFDSSCEGLSYSPNGTGIST